MFPGSLIKSCIIMSVSQTIPDYERNTITQVLFVPAAAL